MVELDCDLVERTVERPRARARPAAPELLARWVREAQRGDRNAQRELIVAYQRRIAGFVFAITARSSDVEDLCQRIFIKMIGAIGTLREPAQFEAWLFRIARHMCLDQIRRNKVRQIFTPFLPHHADIVEPSGGVDSEERDALQHALAQLSPKDRALIALVQEGRSQMEISALLSINIAATKARIHRVRQRLREHYEARR